MMGLRIGYLELNVASSGGKEPVEFFEQFFFAQRKLKAELLGGYAIFRSLRRRRGLDAGLDTFGRSIITGPIRTLVRPSIERTDPKPTKFLLDGDTSRTLVIFPVSAHVV